MNDAPTTAKPSRPLSSFAVRARARRAEELDVKETAACAATGRCACGLPATVGARCAVCERIHRAAVKSAFGGL
jgi:hypothetical protein